LLQKLDSDFDYNNTVPVADRFREINHGIKDFSLEVKSVVLKDDDGVRVYYHGISNIGDDAVARDYGSRFTATELKFFFEIAVRLTEEKYLGTADIHRIQTHRGSVSETESFLSKLHAEGWITRNDSNYWVLGVRTHLELRTQLEEALLQAAADEEGQVADDRKADLQRLVASLPQIIIY